MSPEAWIAIIGIIITALVTFIIYILQKRDKRKEKEEEEKRKGVKLSDLGFTIPEELSPNQKGNLIVITTIQHFDSRTIVVNLEYKGSSLTAKNIQISISEDDICRLQNADCYPIEQVYKDNTFVVRLERHRYNSEQNTRFGIDWNDNDGQHTEVKEIDFEKGLEIKSQFFRH